MTPTLHSIHLNKYIFANKHNLKTWSHFRHGKDFSTRASSKNYSTKWAWITLHIFDYLLYTFSKWMKSHTFIVLVFASSYRVNEDVLSTGSVNWCSALLLYGAHCTHTASSWLVRHWESAARAVYSTCRGLRDNRKSTAVCCDVSNTLASHHPEYLKCIRSYIELFISNSEAMMQKPMKLWMCKDCQDFWDFSLLKILLHTDAWPHTYEHSWDNYISL